jgi:hypothetical protein
MTETTPYPAWMRAEQIAQAVRMAVSSTGRLPVVPRPETRSHVAWEFSGREPRGWR